MKDFKAGDKVSFVGPAIIIKSASISLEWVEDESIGLVEGLYANGHVRIKFGNKIYEVHIKQCEKVA